MSSRCLRSHSSNVFSQIISAIKANDVATLERLMCSPAGEICDVSKQRNILNLSIHLSKYESFTYLSSLDYYDSEGLKIALEIFLRSYKFDTGKPTEQIGVDLVNKCENANLFDCEDDLLHLALQQQAIQVARALIEKGADVNARNDEGCTPFHMLFHQKDHLDPISEGVALMLYHGVDASITDNNGHLPFDLAVIYDPRLVTTQQTLFYYTFDKYSKYKISSEVLCELLESDSPLLSQIGDIVSDVVCPKGHFITPSVFLTMRLETLRVMIDKFSCVISRVFLQKSSFFWHEIQMTPFENWELLLNSSVASDVVQFITRLKIEFIIERLREDEIQTKTIHDFLYYLLSYGLNVWSRDLEIVYRDYGFCELFKALLHMDIREGMCDVMPRIVYDVRFELDRFLENPHNFSLCAFTELLSYFSRPMLRYHCLMFGVETFLKKASTLPKVPTLEELARDQTRKFLIKKFRLRNSRQFFWLLNRLPIGIGHKKILSYENKLY